MLPAATSSVATATSPTSVSTVGACGSGCIILSSRVRKSASDPIEIAENRNVCIQTGPASPSALRMPTVMAPMPKKMM